MFLSARRRRRRFLSPTPPTERIGIDRILAFDMRDDETIGARLEQLRGQLLQWGTPELRVFVTTKDELRGWIRDLEWVLQRPSG